MNTLERSYTYRTECNEVIIKPRRIVLEETGEDNVMDGGYYKDQGFMQGKVLVVSQHKIWREVKEE